MAQSSTDVCNSALQKVGATGITSLDSDLREARQVSKAYESCRKKELRKHRWNFALRRVVLAPDTTAPVFDYSYQFTLPSDCLRVILPSDYSTDWLVEGRKILTNEGAVLKLRYIADVEDATQWDSLFYDLMATSIALEIGPSMTGVSGQQNALLFQYNEIIKEARRTNAFEKVPASAPDDAYWIARLG